MTPLPTTNQNNGPTLYAAISNREGKFMGGCILSDDKKGCVCGGKFIQVNINFLFKDYPFLKQDEGDDYSVPVCEFCKSAPRLLRIKRYVPGKFGDSGKKITIRYSHTNKRLTKIFDAIAVMKLIDKEIHEHTFDPMKYTKTDTLNALQFDGFVAKKYLPYQEKRAKNNELSPEGLKKKKTAIKHLVKFFGDRDLRAISRGAIREFYDSWEDRFRARDLATQELAVILKYAVEIEFLTHSPTLPKIKESQGVSADNILSPQEQERVLSHFENPLYRAMAEILIFHALRPCEVRALQWRDIDFKNKIIKIERHFSLSKIIEGRKSVKQGHYIPLLENIETILSNMPRPMDSREFIFKGSQGGAVGERVLSRAWLKAMEAAFKDVRARDKKTTSLYEGTKHSRLTYLKSMGFSDEDIMLLTGHTSPKALKRYTLLSDQVKMAKVREILKS